MATLQAILDATAHFLVEEADFDTNRVAQRAGVSIGSLYQYFPNKQALLSALIERRVREKIARLSELATEGTTPERRIEHAIDFFIADKRAGLALEQALLVHFQRVGDLRAIAALDEPALSTLAPLVGGSLRAFVLFHGVRAALLAASLARPDALADGSLRSELIMLARGYLHEADR
ncbi:MAG TPA: helix-turn-helix domain-containing protein [Polyangiales bacterium]